jgi:hypothetical protein
MSPPVSEDAIAAGLGVQLTPDPGGAVKIEGITLADRSPSRSAGSPGTLARLHLGMDKESREERRKKARAEERRRREEIDKVLEGPKHTPFEAPATSHIIENPPRKRQ